MIKKVLKRIFPVAFLKQAFLVVNVIKKSTVDKILYREFKVPTSAFMVHRNDYPFRLNNIQINSLEGSPAHGFMKHWLSWTQEEFVVELNHRCCIEPDYGWAVVGTNRLVYESIAFSRTAHQPKPKLAALWGRKSVMSLSCAISLRDSGEENYFHFFNDVLTKLFLLRQYSVPVGEIPIIISAKLWNKPYFQHYYGASEFLKSLNWVLQDREYIECDKVIFCKPMTHRKDLWDIVVGPLIKQSSNPFRKIFLTRERARLRFIQNKEEVEAIMASFGFDVVDTDLLSPDAQIKLFSETAVLVGIHGAGLTNIIFAPSTCKVLELFPPPDLGYLPYHYILLAGMKGLTYSALIGDKATQRFSGGFYVNPATLERAVADLVLR